jgi:diamine N-acetyltransferase
MVQRAIQMLAEKLDTNHFALSYQPKNTVAKHLYSSLGFVETNEWEDDEIVARMVLD